MTADRCRLSAGCANVLIAFVLSAVLALAACASSKQSQAKLLRLARAADANYRSGDFTAAKRQYEALLESNPRYATAQVRLGVIAHREGDREAARHRFEDALRIDAQNDTAAYNLAMLSLNEATQHLEQYVAIVPAAGKRERVLSLLQRLREFEED